MNVTIEFENSISVQESQDLDELFSSMNIDNATIEKRYAPTTKGKKSIDPTLALTIVATGFTALGAIAGYVSAWGDKKSYSITLKTEQLDYTVTGLSPKEFEQKIKKLRQLEEKGVKEVRYIIGKG